MGMTMRITADDPQGTTAVLLDGTGTDPWKLVSADWGNAAWQTAFSGPRGTQGARAASSQPMNRTVQVAFRSSTAASWTDAATRASAIAEAIEALRRYGGRLTVQHTNQSYRHHFRVLAGTTTAGTWSNQAERGVITYGMTFTASPYVEGDSMQVVDRFLTDTEADYTIDTGSGVNVTVGGGQLKSSATLTAHELIHTATGYTYGDLQSAATFVPSTLGFQIWGAIVKRTTAGTYLRASVRDDGAASTMTIDKLVSGASTTLATVALARISIGQPFTVVCRIEGNVVYAEYWAPGTTPSLAGTATTATSITLTGAELATFGEAATGRGGVYLYPNAAADYCERVEITPYVYRGANLTGPVTLPGHLRLAGAIPGDAPATTTIDVGMTTTGGGQTTAFGMIGWARRPTTWNMVPDPGFEWGIAVLGRPWSVAAVAGVTGAASSLAAVTGGRYGINCGSVVTPATANTGTTCELIPPGGFRPGVTYTAELWVRSVAGTTLSRLRLGVSGDIASETAAALTTAWVRRTVTWTPTARQTRAYLAFEVTAATATTILIDGASVYEGTAAPTLPSQRDGNGGMPPFGVIEGQAAHLLNGFVTVAGAQYLNSRGISWTVGLTASAEWMVDPALIPRDPHAESVDVEVWAAVDTGATGLSCVTSAQTFTTTGTATYTREFGTTGRTNITAVRGLTRLGTLPLVPSKGAVVPQRIVTSWACTVIGSGVQIAYLLLVIPSQRQASPTAKPTTNYPIFGNTSGSVAITRRILPDGTGQAASNLSGIWSQGPALIGPLLEPDATNIDVMATVARFIPDTSTGPVTAQFRNGGVAITPTPRWHIVRDA